MDVSKLNKMDIPPSAATRKEVEQVIRDWRSQRDVRLALDKQAAQAKAIESMMRQWLIDAMVSQEYEGVVIDGKITGVSTKEVPDVIDKDEYLDYVRTTGELDLLQFRPAVGAIRLRLEDGIEVPGVALKEVPDLFNRKA